MIEIIIENIILFLFWIAFPIALVYFIIQRIKERKKENFEDRDN
jgi:hypothetical protein